MTLRFQPDASVRAELRRRCTVGGVVVTDVVWVPERGCLCVMDLRKDGKWLIDRELRADDGSPRQVHLGDAAQDAGRIYGRSGQPDDKWYDRFSLRRAEREQRFANERSGVYKDIAKASVRAYRGLGTRSIATTNKGARDWSEYQEVCPHRQVEATCPECRPDKPIPFYQSGKGRGKDGNKGFSVVDRRRVS